MIFIENLTVRGWLFTILPALLGRRSRNLGKPLECLVIDSTRVAWWLASRMAAFLRINLNRFSFNLIDVRDEKNYLIRLKIANHELQKFQDKIKEDVGYKTFSSLIKNKPALEAFILKSQAAILIMEPGNLGRSLFILHLCHWKLKKDSEVKEGLLWLEKPIWSDILKKSATDLDLHVRFLPGRIQIKKILKSFLEVLPESIGIVGKIFLHRRKELRSLPYWKSFFSWIRQSLFQKKDLLISNYTDSKVAVEYYGHLNLDQPKLYSDLTFWSESPLKGSDVKVLFGLPGAPLTDHKREELKAKDIQAVLTRPEAGLDFLDPVYNVDRTQKIFSPKGIKKTIDSRFVIEKINQFENMKKNWTGLFDQENIKIFLTWFKYGASHIAISEAMKSVGGISAIYQRAFDALPSPALSVHADLSFSFSNQAGELERKSGSVIPYYITTGYLGDHRFSWFKESANKLKEQLREKGASKIISYFDENSADDSRWHTGHGLQRGGYQFLLEKVLSNSDLGVIFKPKVPRTLRHRLGPVADLLAKAEKTGRCVVIEGGRVYGAYPPAGAALASDFAIHSCLAASTAGVEAALAGVRTVLLDQEGCPDNPLYRLGNKVVFKDWDSVWSATEEFYRDPSGPVGDWGNHLNDFDPFRDGHASERMGRYLTWILDGYKIGLDRDRILQNAADKYRDMWGEDKVSHINWVPPASVQKIKKKEKIQQEFLFKEFV